MTRDASLMLCTRGWPGWKYVVKEEIFSFGSVFFAMAVVNVGSVGLGRHGRRAGRAADRLPDLAR